MDFKFKDGLKFWRLYVVIFTPIVLSVLFTASTSKEMRCGYVICVMALYWMTEALPLAVTALMPVFAFPLLGVMSSGDVCLAYMKETNMMFLGGLIVAIAVEHCNLHKRIALFVIVHIGQSPRRLMAGFMLTTMFLSMWISNTASTAMMVPIVDAILQELYKAFELEKELALKGLSPAAVSDIERETPPRNHSHTSHSRDDKRPKMNGELNYGFEDRDEEATQSPEEPTEMLTAPAPNKECKALKDMYFLAVAYAANIGGTGSLTGTGPNLVVKEVLDSSFADPSGMNFASWMAFNVPGMLLCTFIGWIWLQVMFMGIGFRKSHTPTQSPENRKKIEELLRKQQTLLGPISFQEKTVFTIFISLVLLWFFREPGFMLGWEDLFKMIFGDDLSIGDATPAILCAFLLFAIPSLPNFWPSAKQGGRTSPPCLTWPVAMFKVPWGIVLLLGGGFAMAKATNESGLSAFLGESLKGLEHFPSSLSVFLLSLATAMATEVASNTATASIILPIFRDLSLGICVNPLYFMLPAAVCCSYAFMIPVATPPNAIVFGAAGMTTKTMMKAGFVMNVLCVCSINIMINTLGLTMFNLGEMPAWTLTSTNDLEVNCLGNATATV